MKSILKLIMTFMISVTFTFPTYADVQYNDENILENISLENMDSQSFLFGNLEKSKKKIEKVFKRKIKKAKRKAKSLEQASEDLEISLEATFVESLKTKRKLSKKNRLDKLLKKINKKYPDVTKKDLVDSINNLADRAKFEVVKKQLLGELKNSGSEVKFLQFKRDKMLEEIKNASLSKGSNTRKIASNYPNIAEIFFYAVILGASIYVVIILAAIGTILATLGLVVLGALAIVLVFMGVACITGLCEVKLNKTKKHILVINNNRRYLLFT